MLHYDADFDLISDITSQRVEWVAGARLLARMLSTFRSGRYAAGTKADNTAIETTVEIRNDCSVH